MSFLKRSKPLRKTRKQYKNENIVGKKSDQELFDIAWKWFSLYIRLCDNWICFTCNTSKERPFMHAGHFEHGFNDTYFDECNVNCQCDDCNYMPQGNRKVYEQKLIEKYGIEVVKSLKIHNIGSISRLELNRIILKYSRLVDDMASGYTISLD